MMIYPFQEAFPKQPLPKLDETGEGYLQMVAPLLNEIDFTRTKAFVTHFQQNRGPQLQQQLETIAATAEMNCFYEINNNRVLESRLSLFYQNFGGVLTSQLTNDNVPTTHFIARWIVTLLKFYLYLKQGKFAPDDEMISKPFGIHQYLNLFGQSRIPQIDIDTLHRAPNSRHIIVIRHHIFYSLTVIKDEALLSIEAIAQQIDWILKQTSTKEPALGALTTLNRDDWARLRSHLVHYDLKNESSLKKLDNALVVVCLDENISPQLSATTKNAVYGDGRNRWFDKSLQLIFAPNNQLAFNIEHTGLDGYPTLRFFADAYRYAQQSEEQPIPPLQAVVTELPQRLQWHLSEEILENIRQAEQHNNNLIASHEARVIEFKEFGRTFIAQQQLHADALVQLSLQLAYFRLYGQMTSIAEPVYMGHFRYGRVDTIRSSVTTESLQLINALIDNVSSREQWQALKKADEAHISLVKKTKSGMGIDRHLLALQSLARQQGTIPDLFRDKVYTEIFRQSTLSTTSLPHFSLDYLIGFHPEVTDGYGIFYHIKSDRINLVITSQEQQLDQFVDLLQLSLSELAHLQPE